MNLTNEITNEIEINIQRKNRTNIIHIETYQYIEELKDEFGFDGMVFTDALEMNLQLKELFYHQKYLNLCSLYLKLCY